MRVRKNLTGTSTVQPTSVTFDVIALGKTAILKVFGGTLTPTGCCDLYWGNGDDGWQFVRSIYGTTYEYPNINDEYVGDDTSMFKIVYMDSAAGSIRYWLEYILGDV